LRKKYGIALEVSGKLGMFARPETGSDGCSYPIPPASACLGIIQSVCRVRGAEITVVAVGVCSEPRLVPYSLNSNSAIRKQDTINSGDMCQKRVTVLENPTFQILAYVVTDASKGHERYTHINHAHSLQEQFNRRLKDGQNFTPVCLGWKEFIASYVGVPKSPVLKNYHNYIGTFTHGDYHSDSYYQGLDVQPIQNAKISNGVFCFTNDEVKVDNVLQFADPAQYNM